MNEGGSFASNSYPMDLPCLLSTSPSHVICFIESHENSGLARKPMWVHGSTHNEMVAQEARPLIIVTVPSVNVAVPPSAVRSQELSGPSYQVPRCVPNQVQLQTSSHYATPYQIFKQPGEVRSLGNLVDARGAGEFEEQVREENDKKHVRGDFGESIKADDETDEGNSAAAVLDNDEQVREPRIRQSHRSQWQAMYQELCNYHARFGTCHIHHTYKENVPLLRWVKRQRYQYTLLLEGKRSRMTKERIKALEAIGFVWHYQEATWYDHLEDLKAFKRVHGHCNVPSKLKENPKLAAWVQCQRKQFQRLRRHRESNLTPQRIFDLESLGFEWETKRNKRCDSD